MGEFGLSQPVRRTEDPIFLTGRGRYDPLPGDPPPAAESPKANKRPGEKGRWG